MAFDGAACALAATFWASTLRSSSFSRLVQDVRRGEGRGADIEPIRSPICGTAAAAAASRSGETIGDARFEFALDSARLGAFDGGFDGAALPGRDVFFFLSASSTSASSSAEINGHVASAATDGGCTSPPA